MRISNKQRKTIAIARYFSVASREDIRHRFTPEDLTYYGLTDCTEVDDGYSAEEAFLMLTDRGIRDMKVTDLTKLLRLLVGHNRAALQVKAWSEGFREGILYMIDFEDEPEEIKELAKKAFEASKSSRYEYVQPLGINQAGLDFIKTL